jgi:EmrB/QacA subfamily drug resistance transporter
MPRPWKVLVVTAVAVFMGFLDVTIVNVAFPDLERDFSDSSAASLSWILNGYNVVFAALLVPAGRVADLVGRRRLFFVGLWLFLAASAASAAAPSVEFLVGARVVQAAGAAILVPTSLGLLLPEFPPERRATATAIWGATGAVAAALGPSLGGVLVDAASWRWVFLVNLPIGLAALIPARAILIERRDEQHGALPDLPGALLLVLGVGLVALAIVQGEDWGWGGARVLGSLAAGLVLLVALVRRSGRHPAPALELSLFRVRSFAVGVSGVFLFSLGFYALLLGNILFLTQVWGYSVLTAGFAVTPGPLMAAVWAPIGGRLSDRFGQRVVALPGGLLFAAGTLLIAARVGGEPHYVSDFLPATVLTGAGVGLSFAAWSSAAVAELPPARFATGSAISACLRQVGAVLGIAVLIAVLGAADPAHPLEAFRDTWRLEALGAFAAAAAALGLGRVRAGVPAGEPAPAAESAPAVEPVPEVAR